MVDVALAEEPGSSRVRTFGRIGARIGLLLCLLSGAVPQAAQAALSLTGTPPNSVVAGQNYYFKPQAYSSTNAKLTFYMRNRPVWARLSSTTGVLSGIPNSSQVGTYYNMVMGVTDGKGWATTRPFAITVTAPSTSGGGTLALGASSYAPSAGSNSVAVTVSRAGSVTGAATVKYATTDGTATAGTNYTAATGTLSWAANDASAKTINIALASSQAYSGTKTFGVALTGPTGATLATPSSAQVTVTGTASSGSGGGGSGGSTTAPPFPSASTPPAAGVSSPGGSTTQPGVAAALGAPSSTLFNGLQTVLDPQFHFPNHGVLAAASSSMPSALRAANLPYVPGLRVLARRDALLLYFSNVAGAADYRAYVVNSNVSFVNTANGPQPRGAVIACAGFRQHTYESAVVNGNHQRELLQTVEVPGLVDAGNYTVILEATSSPCPFVGMSAHTDATITGTNFHQADPATYTYTGTHYAKLVSSATQMVKYGNEIINGQGGASSWASRMSAPMGLTVAANDATFPSDPKVIARSAIAVQMPFFDEATNAPILDKGVNAVEDNFPNDLVVDPKTYTVNPDYAGSELAASAPMTEIPGAWKIWGRYLQQVDTQTGIVNGVWSPVGMQGLQVFQQHGRLYTTFGDGGQDVGGAISIASLKTAPLQMDPTKYIHAMFRVNSESSGRRYWTWTLCGGQTAAELQDPTTHEYKIHPVFLETSFDAGATASGTLYADNPSVAHPQLGALAKAAAQSSNAKECLSMAMDGTPEYPRSDGNVRSSAVIRAQIHPAGYVKGAIPLGNAASDPTGGAGFRYKLDGNKQYAGPLLGPWDQVNPLTHYDMFVRPDRLVVFINGREGFCVDLSGRPLTMKYGIVTFGDLLYHSALEWQNISAPAQNGYPTFASQDYQVTLNTPIATSRAWDVLSQAQQIDIPAQFATFDPNTCVKPGSTAIQ